MPVTSLQGVAFFPGLAQIISCSYTLSHGITPGVAVIECAPQAGYEAEGGPLVFQFGGVRIVLADCKVDRHSIRTTKDGQIWQLAVVDRRWKWAYGAISGHYNLRQPDGSIDKSTLTSAQDLAVLLLEAMGEVGYDVSQMPRNAYPLADWEAVNPAQELASLVEAVGCRVVLQVNGLVAICPLGQGFQLPVDATVVENALTIDPPEHPDSLTVFAGKTRYEADLALEPVGQDLDGSVKPIDLLSYAPAGGWAKENPRVFSGVSGTADPDTNLIPRDLAKQTVYRWYQITEQNPHGAGLLQIPGYPLRIPDRRLLFPIEDVLVQTKQTPEGENLPIPAQVYGIFWDGGTGYTNTHDDTRYKGSFTIDANQGVVKFSDYVVQTKKLANAKYQFLPADLVLRCAVSIRDPQTRAWSRYTKTQPFPGTNFGTGTQPLLHDEFNLNVYPVYGDNNVPNPKKLVTNQADVDSACAYYLAGALAQYQTKLPYDVTYAGLRLINPDGAIQQVSWSVSLAGAITRASRNNEFSLILPSQEERRTFERLRNDSLKELAKLVNRQRAQKNPPAANNVNP